MTYQNTWYENTLIDFGITKYEVVFLTIQHYRKHVCGFPIQHHNFLSNNMKLKMVFLAMNFANAIIVVENTKLVNDFKDLTDKKYNYSSNEVLKPTFSNAKLPLAPFDWNERHSKCINLFRPYDAINLPQIIFHYLPNSTSGDKVKVMIT